VAANRRRPGSKVSDTRRFCSEAPTLLSFMPCTQACIHSLVASIHTPCACICELCWSCMHLQPGGALTCNLHAGPGTAPLDVAGNDERRALYNCRDLHEAASVSAPLTAQARSRQNSAAMNQALASSSEACPSTAVTAVCELLSGALLGASATCTGSAALAAALWKARPVGHAHCRALGSTRAV